MNFFFCKLVICFGFVSGGYQSFKTLREDRPGTDLLKFWIILGCISLFEEYAEVFISWIPLYYVFKFIILVLLTYPQSTFTKYIFEALVQDVMKQLQKTTELVVLPGLHNGVCRFGRKLEQLFIRNMLDGMPSAKLTSIETEMKERLERVQEQHRRRKDS